jgi:hypothetical protein
MTLGRTSSGAIKIKTDTDGGGLRAVGCACCGGCLDYLLYPGELMNVKFDHNDLPDSLEFVDYELGEQLEYYSLQKTTPFFTKNYFDDEPSGTFYYKTASEFDPDTGQEYFDGVTISNTQNYWAFSSYVGPSAENPEEPYGLRVNEQTYYAYTHNFLCSEPPPPEEIESSRFYFMFDLFADTLRISFATGSQVVTRGTRVQYPPQNNAQNTPMVLSPYASCEGYGSWAVLGRYLGGGYMLYFDYVLDYTSNTNPISESCKWKIKTPNGTFTKIGYGNTPVGSYEGGYTVS